MQAILVQAKKGGVGKSLLARELSQALAALGCRVLLIDASEQANDDILENKTRKFGYTLKECIVNGFPLIGTNQQVRKNLWLLAGSRDHEEINAYIRKERYPDILRDMLADLRDTLGSLTQDFDSNRFPWWSDPRVPMHIFQSVETNDEEFAATPASLDFVFIDSDASTENDLALAIWDAIDGILVPFEPTETDWQSYHQIKQDLSKRYRRRPDREPPIIGVIPNKVLHLQGSTIPLTYLRTLYQTAEERVFRPVHLSRVFGECLNLGIGGLEHPAAHSDRAVREICAIALEFIGYAGELAGLRLCEKCKETLS